MKRQITNLPASVRARLANLAREQRRPFQEVLQFYAIERFLYRLAQSRHSTHFLLKGALLFYCRGATLSRPTRDIDLEGLAKNNSRAITVIVREVCRQRVEPDGMEFDADSVLAQDTQGPVDYQGLRVRFMGRLGNARIPMQVDIGFADKVIPGPVQVAYPTLLDMPAPSLRGYTYETIIAEKLQAIVSLGLVNTRIKDFFDIQQLARQVGFSEPTLLRAITATFQQRQTAIPLAVPSGLTDEYAAENQRQWRAFLSRIDAAEQHPETFSAALEEIRAFVMPVLEAAARGADFDMAWPPGGPWQKR